MKKKYYSLAVEEKEANIYIYGDIVSWEWFESDVSSYTLAKEIEALSKDIETINVFINSYGGEVAEGLAIYNALRRHKAKVKTYCDGFACSAASVVFMAGDERIMSNASLLMIHNAWLLTIGDQNQLRKDADDLETINQATINAYMNHVNITEEELKAMMDTETWILPDEALEKGFATSIVNVTATDKAAANARKALFSLVKKAHQGRGESELTPVPVPKPEFKIDFEALRSKAAKKIQMLEEEEGPGLEDWLYLIHHVHVDPDTGKEIIHHCPLVDHLGNLYQVEHIMDEDGEMRHCLTGLMEDQEVYWSDEEAEADGQEVPCANRQLEGD